ncbi:hypothetical protein M407DRAFT_17460 [Tulasnella calospora MUT 4182]|uniref:DUF962 domain-containing protein n=1 Tax=Tulasnella calospora MUT 4182 TaxID=1051891 RepID=A0A0C3QXQ2_9AGAM|nr:hypothetical protein M407DRAFT_17460 [Tulasnella calospora MUT 4182]
MSSKREDQVANPSYTPHPYNFNGYASFDEFYPFYLGEHSHPKCRRLHLVGTLGALTVLLRVLVSFLPGFLTHFRQIIPPARLNFLRIRGGKKAQLKIALIGVIQGYIFSWIGHFFYERNKPATFKHPWYSLRGDLRMLKEVLLRLRKA